MRDFFVPLFMVSFVLLSGCHHSKKADEAVVVNADSLVVNIEKYNNAKVETEGTVIHICGVDKKKLKLKTDDAHIIKVVWQDTSAVFDEKWYKKRVRVKGVVRESRISKEYIERIKQNKTLLCHIDYSACKDSSWVQNKIDAGINSAYSDNQTKLLDEKMRSLNKDYVSVVTIVAEECELVK